MLNFLRRIRKKLIAERRAKNYLAYAIGEILLIVFGILIALQINNWNANKKNRQLESNLLEGIKFDLIDDTTQVKDRFLFSYNRFKKSIFRFDSIINQNDNDININDLDSLFDQCTRQRNTFWPVTGTYQSIVNNRSSNLITNANLFKQIQNHYEKAYRIIKASGERIDNLSDQIRYKVKDYSILSEEDRLNIYRSKVARNEIEYWYYQVEQFSSTLLSINKKSIQLISRIDLELNK